MLASLSRGASELYRTAVHLKNLPYDQRLRHGTVIEGTTVVSIGALRAGGSGKTPIAVALADELRSLGARIAIVTRGYKGALERRGGLVSAGDGPLVDASEAGDEAYMMARQTRGIAVIVGADRIAAARQAVELGCEVVILDDGFSHRRIARDVDILLAAPEDLDDHTRLLPRGPLREPSSAAQRAHLIAGLTADWPQSSLKGTAFPQVLFDYKVDGYVDLADRRLPTIEPESVWAVAGIARPERFLSTIKSQGHTLVGQTLFRDHRRISEIHWRQVQDKAAVAGAQMILTTEKDLLRQPVPPGAVPVYALRIAPRVMHGGAVWDALVERVLKLREE